VGVTSSLREIPANALSRVAISDAARHELEHPVTDEDSVCDVAEALAEVVVTWTVMLSELASIAETEVMLTAEDATPTEDASVEMNVV